MKQLEWVGYLLAMGEAARDIMCLMPPLANAQIWCTFVHYKLRMRVPRANESNLN